MTRKTVTLSAAVAVALSLVAGISCAAGASKPGAQTRAAHRISMQEARKTALGRVPGSVKAQELEHERGRWIYSFEIRPAGETRRIIREVNVDADTGAIVDVTTEPD